MPTQPSLSVLLGEPHDDIAVRLADQLIEQGLPTDVLHDGEQLWQRLQQVSYGVVIADSALPNRSGFEVLRQWRMRSTQPMMMLTEPGADAERIAALELGADDCLDRNCNPRELVARVRALWRRANQVMTPATLRVGQLQLDASTLQVRLSDQVLNLTYAEFKVLEMLLRVPGQAQSRDALAARVLGRKPSPYNRSIDTHVSNLRRKLRRHVPGQVQIRSIRGMGYMLTLPDGVQNAQ